MTGEPHTEPLYTVVPCSKLVRRVYMVPEFDVL